MSTIRIEWLKGEISRLNIRINEDESRRSTLLTERTSLRTARNSLRAIFLENAMIVSNVSNTHNEVGHDRFRGRNWGKMRDNLEAIQDVLRSQISTHSDNRQEIYERIQAINTEREYLLGVINNNIFIRNGHQEELDELRASNIVTL